jgi:pantoate--beta-alanine ligase
MKIISDIKEMREYVLKLKKRGHTIGFVPTMGALHDGHMSLVSAAAADNEYVVVSIFVNSTQFAPGEDFEKYPRPISGDIKMLKATKNCDCLFTPDNALMYPDDYATYIQVENDMPKCLCGVTRPIHFKGVTTVISKFLNIINPDRIYFGQKDAQQSIIVTKMVKDMNYAAEVVVCPIFREKDGLALSSRNIYLTPEQRNTAPVLNKTLQMAESMIELGERSCEVIKKEMRRKLKEGNVVIDYVETVDFVTLKPVDKIAGKVLIAAAIYVGKTRLIDNTIVDIK